MPGRPPDSVIVSSDVFLLEDQTNKFNTTHPESLVDSISVGHEPAATVKVSDFPETCFVLPNSLVFVDRVLPASEVSLEPNAFYPVDYFVMLHNLTASAGEHYAAGTPNYLGARIPLEHTRFCLPKWREYLADYEQNCLVQFLEFGFPLGLSKNPSPRLVSSTTNHGSSYKYYKYLDEFFMKGLEKCELSGPCRFPPFKEVHISPLMTAPKKPFARRVVFDATFGEYSLNRNTPGEMYCNEICQYDYPSVDDFREVIVKAGRGCLMWKRDLSRFYLQIPLDPVQYPLVCCIWRNRLFFFTALMFGLTHSGLQGQKISSAVAWIHRGLGLKTKEKIPFTCLNYSDDFGGCESTEKRAWESFLALSNLLSELGLIEADSKAHSPSTKMPYLGVEFDTMEMTMSVPPEKVEELRNDLSLWKRKKNVNKRSLQSILGKLFWVSRCVKYSRGFMSRLLSQLRSLSEAPDHKNVPIDEGCKEDINWWSRYLRHFNGTELIQSYIPLDLPLHDMLDSGAIVVCGDAQPNGGGAYCGEEYWSREFHVWLNEPTIPIHIKEFWVLIVSTGLWSSDWSGKPVYFYCDNQAVVEVLNREKPKDPEMQMLLREFLYFVCSRSFNPIIRHVSSKENSVADFLSRNHKTDLISCYLKENYPKLGIRKRVPDGLFKLNSVW